MKTADIESVANRQSRRCCVSIPMDISNMMNTRTTQRRIFYASIIMDISTILYVVTTQRHRGCANIPMDISTWWIRAPRNAVYFMPIFQWMNFSIWIPSWCNIVGVMPVFQWTHLSSRMFSSRNSVRVVLLIAQGWRGTSLPRVNVRKGIQRHRCWAFSKKAWV